MMRGIIFYFVCIMTLVLNVGGCKKNEIKIEGDGILYLNEIVFSDFVAASGATGTINAKFYVATDTTTSLVVSETNTKFFISDINRHNQIQSYSLPDRIKKLEFFITFDLGDYVAKKVRIGNITFNHRGNNKFLHDEVVILSDSAISFFSVEPIIIEFD